MDRWAYTTGKSFQPSYPALIPWLALLLLSWWWPGIAVSLKYLAAPAACRGPVLFKVNLRKQLTHGFDISGERLS